MTSVLIIKVLQLNWIIYCSDISELLGGGHLHKFLSFYASLVLMAFMLRKLTSISVKCESEVMV